MHIFRSFFLCVCLAAVANAVAWPQLDPTAADHQTLPSEWMADSVSAEVLDAGDDLDPALGFGSRLYKVLTTAPTPGPRRACAHRARALLPFSRAPPALALSE